MAFQSARISEAVGAGSELPQCRQQYCVSSGRKPHQVSRLGNIEPVNMRLVMGTEARVWTRASREEAATGMKDPASSGRSYERERFPQPSIVHSLLKSKSIAALDPVHANVNALS